MCYVFKICIFFCVYLFVLLTISPHVSYGSRCPDYTSEIKGTNEWFVTCVYRVICPKVQYLSKWTRMKLRLIQDNRRQRPSHRTLTNNCHFCLGPYPTAPISPPVWNEGRKKVDINLVFLFIVSFKICNISHAKPKEI